MATIGTLAAKVVADTSGFTMGMMSVRKEMANTQKSMSSGGGIMGMIPVFDPVSLGIKAVGAAFDMVKGAVTAVTDAIGGAFDRIQDIGNAAQSLGMSAHSFQVLQVAAGNADVEMETLTRGIYEMQKSLAAGGSAEKSIAALGLSFSDLKGMAPEKQFAAISEALSNVTDQNTRVKVINDLFGKSGLELKRLFDGGGEAIESATDQLARMGEVTESDVEAIGLWDAAWKELKGTVGGIFNALTVELAPVITDMIRMFSDFFQSAEVKEYLTRSFMIWRRALELVVDAIRPVLNWLREFLNMLGEVYGYAVRLHEFVFGAEHGKVAQRPQQQPAGGMQPNIDDGDMTKDIRDPLADDAKRLMDSLRTPFQVIEDRIKHFRMLADLGYIGEQDFDKLAANAIDTLKEPPKQEFRNEAMVAGSQSAIQFLANQKYGDPNKATWDAMRKALDQIAKNTKPQKEAGPAVVPAF